PSQPQAGCQAVPESAGRVLRSVLYRPRNRLRSLFSPFSTLLLSGDRPFERADQPIGDRLPRVVAHESATRLAAFWGIRLVGRSYRRRKIVGSRDFNDI